MLKFFLLAIVFSYLECAAFVSPRKWGVRRVSKGLTGLKQNVLECCSTISVDEVAEVRYLTASALERRGEKDGYAALQKLGELCKERRPYDFSVSRSGGAKGSVLSHVPQLLPQTTTESLFNKVEDMVQNGWLSTNLDSVDGLPSFHINLVSNGEPVVPSDVGDGDLDGFQRSTKDLLTLIEPYIYESLLPQVNNLLNATNIRVSDIFLRRYGEVLSDEKSRNGISAHYDVFSKVTSVIALDDTASCGRNGLYTTVSQSECENEMITSNHAALRRFFPLKSGDAVVHTWDVLHGVAVAPGLARTSLIIWFTTEEELATKESNTVSPWLSDRDDLTTNDVAQFVLASAIESSLPIPRETACDNSAPRDVMFLSSPNIKTMPEQLHPHDLYIESASRGNSFALTRLGSLCENSELSDDRESWARKVLLELVKESPAATSLPANMGSMDSLSSVDLAKRFWYEGAIRGNPLAQIALADEIMFELSCDNSQNSDIDAAADARLFAATLFALATQQGNEIALEALTKVVQLEVSAAGIENEDDFENSAVVRVAAAASSS